MAVFANIGGWIADTLVSRGLSITAVRRASITICHRYQIMIIHREVTSNNSNFLRSPNNREGIIVKLNQFVRKTM